MAAGFLLIVEGMSYGYEPGAMDSRMGQEKFMDDIQPSLQNLK